MARVQFTGAGRLTFCPAMADYRNPKTSEVTAGVELVNMLRRDSLDLPSSGKTVDIADAGSLFDKTAPGTYGGDAAKMDFYRDSLAANDKAFSSLQRGASGFLVVSRFGWQQSVSTGLGIKAGVPTALDRCEVYPVSIISREQAKTGENDANMMSVNMAITDEPADDAKLTT